MPDSRHRVTIKEVPDKPGVANMVGGRSGQLQQSRTQLAMAYRNYVTSRPFVAVGSALLAGYLLGRLWKQ